MHQPFVSTAPPPYLQGMGGDNDFHFSEPWYKLRPVGTSWGAPRGFGDLGRMAIYFQGAGEHL